MRETQPFKENLVDKISQPLLSLEKINFEQRRKCDQSAEFDIVMNKIYKSIIIKI